MKTILGALTAIMLLAGVAAPASAACWPTPGGWHCSGPYWHHWHHWHHWDRW